MPTPRDYYEVLGISRDATPQQIKSAYRKLAVRDHPDKNPGDREAEERFKEAAEAYAVLSDPDKRAAYDRFGHRGLGGGGFSGFDPSVFGDFADILGDLFGLGFGGRRASRRGEPGSDLRYELHLSLEEAAFGAAKTLDFPRLETCDSCSGSGSAGSKTPVMCKACAGTGQVRYSQGFFTMVRTCPQCNGEGRIVTDPCLACRGAGRRPRKRSLEVRIPAGVESGSRLRVSGEGEHGRGGGGAGDLFVDIAVRPHSRFLREGPHVISRVALSYPQAVLGAELEVETLHGKEILAIPSGTQAGAQFRIKGKGIERLDRPGRGDHVVVAEIAIPHPRALSAAEADLLRRLAELGDKPVREDKTVLERVKSLFD